MDSWIVRSDSLGTLFFYFIHSYRLSMLWYIWFDFGLFHIALFSGCILGCGKFMWPLSFCVLGDQCEMLLKFHQIYDNILNLYIWMKQKKFVPKWDRTRPSYKKSETYSLITQIAQTHCPFYCTSSLWQELVMSFCQLSTERKVSLSKGALRRTCQWSY